MTDAPLDLAELEKRESHRLMQPATTNVRHVFITVAERDLIVAALRDLAKLGVTDDPRGQVGMDGDDWLRLMGIVDTEANHANR